MRGEGAACLGWLGTWCMSWIDSEAIVHRGQRHTRVVTAVLGLLSCLGILFPTAHVYGAIYCLSPVPLDLWSVSLEDLPVLTGWLIRLLAVSVAFG